MERGSVELEDDARDRMSRATDWDCKSQPRLELHGSILTRSPVFVISKSLAAMPVGTRMQPCEAG